MQDPQDETQDEAAERERGARTAAYYASEQDPEGLDFVAVAP